MPEGEGEVMLAGGSGCDSGLACLRNHLISKKNLDFVRRCERWNLGWLYHHCTKMAVPPLHQTDLVPGKGGEVQSQSHSSCSWDLIAPCRALS